MEQTEKYSFEMLSIRELEILGELSSGKSRDKISEKLKISVLTYDGHRKNIRQKLRIRNQLDWEALLRIT